LRASPAERIAFDPGIGFGKSVAEKRSPDWRARRGWRDAGYSPSLVGSSAQGASSAS